MLKYDFKYILMYIIMKMAYAICPYFKNIFDLFLFINHEYFFF